MNPNIKKILLCNAEYPPFAGGGGVYTYLLASGLTKHYKNAQIIVYAGTPHKAFDKKLESLGPQQIIYHSRKLWDLDFGGTPFLQVVQDFEEVIKLFQPTLIHAHHTMECLLAGMVASKHRIPFVMTIQKSPVPDTEDLAKPSWTAIQHCYRFMPYSGIVTTSDVYHEQALQLGARQPVRRIYYGIDPRQFRYDPTRRCNARRSLGIEENQTLVLCPSRIDYRKGIDVLIEATSIARKQVPQLKVLVAGSRNVQAEEWFQFLSGLVRGYHLEGIVTLGAERNSFNQMADLYAAADICVVPSLREGLGISLIEAMATGVPIITTQTVGVTELITHEQNGLVVPVGDAKCLAEAIVELATVKEKCAKFTANATAFIKAKHLDYDSMAKLHIEFFDEILANANK